MSNGFPTYQYVAVEGGWPKVELSGLQIDDAGAMTLAELPALDDELGDPLAPVPGLQGPAGIGVDDCGNIYVADPARHRIIRVDGCDGTSAPLPCLTGPGSGPGQLLAPRGVIVGPRDSLYVADSGNSRIQVFDLATSQLRDIWGMPRGAPRPTSLPGGFYQPFDLAADRHDRIYVADPGVQDADGRWSGGRVQKFDAGGALDVAFSETLLAQPRRPAAPVSVAVALLDSRDRTSERLLVLDQQPSQVLAYRLDGTFDAVATTRWAGVVAIGALPVSLAAGNGVLYLADATSGQVLVFGLDGMFRGVAPSVGAGAAGLALDCQGRLIVHPGSAGSIRRALGLPVYAGCGTFVAGPFSAPSDPTIWQRIQAMVDALPDGTHLRLFTLTSETLDGSAGMRPSPPVGCDGSVTSQLIAADDPSPARLDWWRAGIWDAADVLALNVPANYLWIAGELQGDGRASPAVRQIRLTHDEDGWIRYLPAIFRNDRTSRVFLERALSAFESVFSAEDSLIDDLPRLFDAFTAPDDPAPSWLEWLAGWVDVELRERWDDDLRRRVVAEAFVQHGRRGTIESLRRLIALYTGATPYIEELDTLGIWSLGVTSQLGVETALTAAEAQGAVAGTTAIVDRSTLTSDDHYGRAAFGDGVHRFLVRVYAGGELGGADGLARVRQVIDREKPAHTTYHLCAIDVRMRVGSQARVGIDTVVAGPPAATALGAETAESESAALVLAAGRARIRGGAVGEDARVGMMTTIS